MTPPGRLFHTSVEKHNQEGLLMNVHSNLMRGHMLIGGELVPSEAGEWLESVNPANEETLGHVPAATAADVNRAVTAAEAAQPAWAATNPQRRARVLMRFLQLVERDSEALAATLAREHGKTAAEARASVERGIEMVEFACGIPSLLMGQCLQHVAAGVDCETLRHPVGVCAGITPFNFPVMVPLWMFPVALTCGNTFVLKPSEKVPLSAVRLGELLLEAGLPPGVFNLVHGDRECVEAILSHHQRSRIRRLFQVEVISATRGGYFDPAILTRLNS